MRRVVILGTGLLAVGAAFCAGRASAPKLKLKYPWAGELLNRPCGKTELEWRCATGGIRKDGDIPLTKAFVLRTLTAEIKPKGIVVRADVTRRDGVVLHWAQRGWAAALRDACSRVNRLARQRFGDGTDETKPFANWNSLAVALTLDGLPAMQVVGGNQRTFTLAEARKLAGKTDG